ncbi:PucR family transcriptional regulator [Saccharopolyspora rosea]|uniref:PucR family transcriptional regulator n=1 Tax=Saccharopolyspora rosea TaxID=524884 RepID=UPI0021D804DD|nr:PucR family transcriptional regulator [Saccharopolyspora rosea]
MALTVADVLDLPDLQLRLLTGDGGLDRQVRWAHVIELADPVPWLRGGELVLTIGLGIPSDAAGQRAYVRRLVDAGCAALGFAAGEVLDELPPAVLGTAEELGLPVIAVVGTTPFLAVAEAVARRHAEERSRHERLALAGQDAMARAALRTGHAGVLRELAAATAGEALLLDAAGTVRAASTPERDWHAVAAADRAAGSRGAIGLSHGEWDVHLQSLGSAGGWLALACPRPAVPHTRLLTNHAATLIGVGLAGVRSARVATHRHRSAVFSLMLDDTAGTGPLWQRCEQLCPLPPPPLEVAVLAHPDRSAGDLVPHVLDELSDVVGDVESAERAVVCPRPQGLVVVLPGREQPLGERLTARLSTVLGKPCAAGSAHALSRTEVPRAALRAARARRGPGYHDADDVGAWRLLRDALDPDGTARFTETVLAPLRAADTATVPTLAACLRAVLDRDGNLESAAQVLGIHRNTLRTRLRTAERAVGRPLDDPRTRLQLWLALTLADEG